MTTEEKIETIKKQGYDLDFGTVFNQAFEIYKKIALSAGLAYILFSVLLGIIAFSCVLVFLGISLSMNSLETFKVENLSILGLSGYIFGVAFFSALMSPFSAGLLKMAQDAAKQKEVSIGSIFQYYQGSYFKELFVAAFLIGIFSNLFASGLDFVGFKWLGIVISLLISLLTFLMFPLIIFGDLKAVEAIQGSIIIISKQPLIIVGLLIVATIFVVLGLIAFCIGIFFTMPFLSALHYTIYASIIPDSKETDDLISENAHY